MQEATPRRCNALCSTVTSLKPAIRRVLQQRGEVQPVQQVHRAIAPRGTQMARTPGSLIAACRSAVRSAAVPACWKALRPTPAPS